MSEEVKMLLTAIGAGLLLIGGGIAVGWRWFTKRQDEQHALLIAELNANRERIEKIQKDSKEERVESKNAMTVERDRADEQRIKSDAKVDDLTKSFVAAVKEISDACKESTITSNSNMEKVIRSIEELSKQHQPKNRTTKGENKTSVATTTKAKSS